LIADQTFFVAEAIDTEGARVMVGCGGWSKRRTLFGSDHGPDREPNLLDPETDAAKIRAIFVHPSWARRGIGSKILAVCETAAAASGFTRFEMGSTLTGVPLYRLRGYVEQSRRDIALPNGALLPIVVMEKRSKD
jgi:GNAT superfamily N-acetyltransferase